MSARKKQQRKQEQRRRRNQAASARRKKRRARGQNSPVQELRFDEPTTSADVDLFDSLSESTARRAMEKLDAALSEVSPEREKMPRTEESEAELWWGRYSKADGAACLTMTREKLHTICGDDESYNDYFPDAVYELERKLSSTEYVAFLEELHESYPDIYAQSADWHARSMVSEYLAQGKPDEVDRVAMGLANELTKVDDPFFSLMTTVRLAGRAESAQALIDAAVNHLPNSELMYWAVDEILEWAMFAPYQRCVAAGATNEAIEALNAMAHELDLADDEHSRTARRDFAMHLAGLVGTKLNREELTHKDGWRNVYLLCVDYMRWLCEKHQFEPIVADEFRRLMVTAISRMDCSFGGLLAGLPRQEFDRYLATKVGFMSLDRVAAPATVVAMKLFYDYLLERELIRPKAYKKSQEVCDQLWEQLLRLFCEEEWRSYAFLEQYLPSVNVQPSHD